MDGPAGFWCAPWRSFPLLNVLLAMMLLVNQVQGSQSSCTSTINLPRNTKVEQSKGQTLTLRCPVGFCSGELPNVTWCKIEGQSDLCDLEKTDHRISSEWEQQEKHKAVHVLKLHSAKINDTGYYQCSASFTYGQVVKGTSIEVTIAGGENKTQSTPMEYNTTSATSAPPAPVLQQFHILFYIMASAAALCVILIIVSLAVFCYRRRREKRRSSSDPEPADEVRFVASPTDPEKCLERKLSGASGPPGQEVTTVLTETTYDNAHLCYQSRTPLSPEEDSIVYADLNHDAKKMFFQFEEQGGDVEYATVRVK
ncbi:uncharacterized protein [Hyperolius riggenbachi]|uniref:uncharacterized protein isoform X1 n=1 Tax=Hyperolius riggenbachi TaxID=752182 RepID=UPI0035A2C8F4